MAYSLWISQIWHTKYAGIHRILIVAEVGTKHEAEVLVLLFCTPRPHFASLSLERERIWSRGSLGLASARWASPAWVFPSQSLSLQGTGSAGPAGSLLQDPSLCGPSLGSDLPAAEER